MGGQGSACQRPRRVGTWVSSNDSHLWDALQCGPREQMRHSCGGDHSSQMSPGPRRLAAWRGAGGERPQTRHARTVSKTIRTGVTRERDGSGKRGWERRLESSCHTVPGQGKQRAPSTSCSPVSPPPHTPSSRPEGSPLHGDRD